VMFLAPVIFYVRDMILSTRIISDLLRLFG
jgi:hypothetical protein